MKQTVKLRVYVDSDRITHIVAEEVNVRRLLMLIRPDDLDYIRGDTSYSKVVEGTFTFDDGKPTRVKARKK